MQIAGLIQSATWRIIAFMAITPEFQTTISAYFVDLRNLIEEFNFTRPGKDHVLGEDIAHMVADGIHQRSVTMQSGPRRAFKENAPKYTVWKILHYGTGLIGFRTGQMMSLPSLIGNLTIEPHLITMKYGTDTPPSRGMCGYISEEDKKVTDTQKAKWFTKKKGIFYEPDKDIAERVRAKFAEQLDEYIDFLNQQS